MFAFQVGRDEEVIIPAAERCFAWLWTNITIFCFQQAKIYDLQMIFQNKVECCFHLPVLLNWEWMLPVFCSIVDIYIAYLDGIIKQEKAAASYEINGVGTEIQAKSFAIFLCECWEFQEYRTQGESIVGSNCEPVVADFENVKQSQT